MISSSRPPHSATVVRDRADEFARPIDWSSWYLTDEGDMGESPEQHDVIDVFTSVLKQLGRERNWGSRVLIGGDAFFAWVPEHPLVRVSPDVYLLFDPPPPPLPASWQTWLAGHHPPRLAVEIVSQDWKKDYEDGPRKYAQLGAQELVIFDPGAAAEKGGDRVPLQIYRRTDDGLFVLTYSGPGPGMIHILRLFAVVWPTAAGPRLRLARDAMGTDLIPTTEEAQQAAEEAQQAAEEAQQAADEAQQAADEARHAAEAARDSERAARLALEQELARLRERLAGNE